jgi:hypothetical protein
LQELGHTAPNAGSSVHRQVLPPQLIGSGCGPWLAASSPSSPAGADTLGVLAECAPQPITCTPLMRSRDRTVRYMEGKPLLAHADAVRHTFLPPSAAMPVSRSTADAGSGTGLGAEKT